MANEINIVHLVAAPPNDLDAELLNKAAAVIDKDPYTTRLLLTGKIPKILTSYQTIEDAESAARSIGTLGLIAFVCSDTELRTPFSSHPAFHTLKPANAEVTLLKSVGEKSRLWTTGGKYPLCTKMVMIKSPVNMYVFVDEREDGINDGWFAQNPDSRFNIIDFPASYHGSAGGFSFADGHSEIHKWRDGRTMPVLKQGQDLPLNQVYSGNTDVDWLAQHSAGLSSYP